MTPRRELFLELQSKFPRASTHALARMAYTRAPSLFKHERAAVIAAFAARNGKKNPGTKAYLPKTRFKPGDSLAHFPHGKKHFEDWKPLVISGPVRALVLADCHIPYHDKTAITAAINYGAERGVDLVILDGDTADFFSVSFWEKDPRKRDFAGELETVRDFIFSLRLIFPKARLLYKLGNHEERYERYMFVKSPELLGVPEFEIAEMIGLRPGELVSDKRPIALGDLNIIHGHEYNFAISNPVNPARGLFLRAKAYALCGHFHQSSYHVEKTVEEKNIATWSLGCLCDLHPDYRPMNNWNHGFAYVRVFVDGKFEVENKFIARGGKLY